MIKIRLRLLDFNNSGSFTKAPNPKIDGDGENVMISDKITPPGLTYKQRPFNGIRTSSSLKVNPSTPHHQCWGLLRVTQRRFFTPPLKARFGAAEWVKNKQAVEKTLLTKS
jgi:hypothetical protein